MEIVKESGARCYADYGLNKYRNLMRASLNEKEQLDADTRETLYRFMYSELWDTEIEQCAIFAHANDGQMYALVKETDNSGGSDKLAGVGYWEYMSSAPDMKFFAYLDSRYSLSGYGVLVQDEEGLWTLLVD